MLKRAYQLGIKLALDEELMGATPDKLLVEALQAIPNVQPVEQQDAADNDEGGAAAPKDDYITSMGFDELADSGSRMDSY